MRNRGAVFAIAIATLLAACSTDDTSSTGASASAAAAPSGPWTFTDDRPATTELDETPQRIVAWDESAAALIELGIRPVGIWGGDSGSFEDNPVLEGLDLQGIESVGSWENINYEAVAALDPDLIVTGYFGSSQGGDDLGWGFPNQKVFQTMETIAPIVAFENEISAKQTIERHTELVESLGVDPDATGLSDDIAAYEQALADLRSAAAANPDITVLGMMAYPDEVYDIVPSEVPDFADYQAYGVNFEVPKNPDGGFYETLSWENADTYEGDVILYDARPFAPPLEELEKQPTWRGLAAVKADQLVPWLVPSVQSYARQTASIEALTQAIESAQDVA
jgi:iron complex transport system substrate-binding protein